MPDAPAVPAVTRPATVDAVLLVAVLAAVLTMRGSDVLTVLTAVFLLKTLDPWRHQ